MTVEATPITVVDRLVREFQEERGLSAVDAHRMAFAALACRKGWTKARIARYLGTTRQRVGQKIEKLENYALLGKGMPTLKRVQRSWPPKGTTQVTDALVQYDTKAWQDLDFARRLCDMVA